MKKNVLFQSTVALSLLTAYVAHNNVVEAAETPEQSIPEVVVEQPTEVQKEKNVSETQMVPSTADSTIETDETAVQPQDEQLEITIGLQTVPLTKEKPEIAPVPKRNEPNRVTTTMNETPESSMSFNWFTSDQFDDAEVLVADNEEMDHAISVKADSLAVENQYAERTKEGAMIFEAKTESGEKGYFLDVDISDQNMQWRGHRGEDVILQSVPETIYQATVEGLAPDTKYYFKVGSKKGGYSATGSFKTAAGKEDAPFTFIHYTDTQNAYWNENAHNEARYGAETLAHAIKENPDAVFALHSGDIIEDSAIEDEWLDLLEQSKSSYLNMPQIFISGNHDTGYGQAEQKTSRFRGHTNTPAANGADNSGTYYSVDYNGAHIIVLNTNDNKKDEKDNPEGALIGQEQVQWFKDDVKQARENGANWIIVSFHKPLFSGSYHALQDTDVAAGRDALMQAIDELDVDLVLNGHDHVLSRTLPLVYDSDVFGKAKVDDSVTITTDEDGFPIYTDTKGTLFVVPGTAGTKNYDDLYNGSLEHLREVRPKVVKALGDTPEEQKKNLVYFRSLFDYMDEVSPSTGYQHKHDNWREGSAQQFDIVSVTKDTITVEIYQVKGDLDTGEARETTLLDRFTIKKSDQSKENTPEVDVPTEDDDKNTETNTSVDKQDTADQLETNESDESSDEKETNEQTESSQSEDKETVETSDPNQSAGTDHTTDKEPHFTTDKVEMDKINHDTVVDSRVPEQGSATTIIEETTEHVDDDTTSSEIVAQGTLVTHNSHPEQVTINDTQSVEIASKTTASDTKRSSEEAKGTTATLPQTGFQTAGLGLGLLMTTIGTAFSIKKKH